MTDPRVRLNPDLARALFTQAANEEMGIKIEFEGSILSVEKVIYAVRKENPLWADIMLAKLQGGQSVMLVKKTVELT